MGILNTYCNFMVEIYGMQSNLAGWGTDKAVRLCGMAAGFRVKETCRRLWPAAGF